MRLKNCCAKKKDPPIPLKILKNDVLEDLDEEDEDFDEEDDVFKQTEKQKIDPKEDAFYRKQSKTGVFYRKAKMKIKSCLAKVNMNGRLEQLIEFLVGFEHFDNNS